MVNRITSYQEAQKYIFAHLPMFQRQGPVAYKKDLKNTIQLCQAAGNPQLKLKTIHIAGTNGKGTTTHIIAGGLQSQGYKVGVYTSPHYKDFRERIKINGTYISKKYVTSFIQTHYEAIEEIQPSFFEMTVALAFSYFAYKKVDFVVVETGLGGRLDSTNIIRPILSVITNISYDHQNLLGNTLEEIAFEKAGIIKNGIPVIIGEKQPEVAHVFNNKAMEAGASIYYAEDHLALEKMEYYNNHCIFKVLTDQITWIEQLESDLMGPFQIKNMITGLFALKFLSGIIPIDVNKLSFFFPELKKSTAYIGRWQIIDHNPLVLADSAHNEGGLRIVLAALTKMDVRKIHFVLGFVNDKDLNQILSLFPTNAAYYFAKANIPRGLESKSLQTMAEAYQLAGKAYSSVKKALGSAKKNAGKNDLIFVGGSIFVVAEVI